MKTTTKRCDNLISFFNDVLDKIENDIAAGPGEYGRDALIAQWREAFTALTEVRATKRTTKAKTPRKPRHQAKKVKVAVLVTAPPAQALDVVAALREQRFMELIALKNALVNVPNDVIECEDDIRQAEARIAYLEDLLHIRN